MARITASIIPNGIFRPGQARKLREALEDEILPVVNLETLRLVGYIRKSLNSGPRTGKTEIRGGVERQASAPGEPPKSDTGNLARSVRADAELMGSKVVGFVTVSTPYARALEYGYKPRNLRARPYVQPAIKARRPKINRNVRKAVIRAVRRVRVSSGGRSGRGGS